MYKKQIDFLTYISGQGVNLITPLIITPYILHTCGAVGLGKNAVAFSIAMFLVLIIDYAFDMKLIRDIAAAKDLAAKSKIINHMLSTKLVLLLFLTVTFYSTIWIFSSQLENGGLFSLSFLIVAAQTFSPLSVLQGLQWYRTTAAVNIGSKLIYLALVLSFVTSVNDYLWVNPFWAVANFGAFTAGYFFIFKRLKLRFVPSSFVRIIKTLRDDFGFTLSQLLLCLRQIAPQVLSGYFLGWHTAGVYKIFDQLISLARSMNQVYFKFFLPKLSNQYVFQKTRSISFWKQYSTLAFLGTLAVCLISGYFKVEILSFFKLSSSQIENSGNLYLITLATIVIMPITIAGEQLMIVCDLLKAYTRIIYVVTFATVLGIIFTAPAIGLEGIATIVFLAEILFAIQYMSFSQSKFFAIESK